MPTEPSPEIPDRYVMSRDPEAGTVQLKDPEDVELGAAPMTKSVEPPKPKAEQKPPEKKEEPAGKTCWRCGHSRGMSTELNKCNEDEQMGFNGCYPKCREGFEGSGRLCTQQCPSDFKDYSYYCEKPEGYWRGSGQVQEFPGSEKYGFMFYPECKEGYAPWGCCHCRKKCPDGMKDLVTMCMKDSYQRATARYPTCQEGYVLDPISQECYKECAKGIAAGDMCWLDCNPGTKPCGGALCLDENLKCTRDLREKVKTSLNRIKQQAVGAEEGTEFNAGTNFRDQNLPVCDKMPIEEPESELLDMPPFEAAKPPAGEQTGFAVPYMGDPAPSASDYMQMTQQPYYYYPMNTMFLNN